MTPRGMPTVEELQQEYQARLAEAAKAQFRNEDLVAAWLKFVAPQLVESSQRGWSQCSAHLLEFLELHGLHVLSMTRSDVQQYAAWVRTAPYKGRQTPKPLKAGSVLQHILAGSSLFNHLRDDRRLVTVNPFFPVVKWWKKKHRAELRPDLRAVDEGEVAQLLEATQDLDEFLLVLLLFKTGIRREEASRIRVEQIDWKGRIIMLDPHPRRTHLKAYFDEELEHFLKLKIERNQRDYPDNAYLWPSPQGRGKHLNQSWVNRAISRIVRASPLAATITGKETDIMPHTFRRGFTSVLKRNKCPSHVVAVLRGDSLLSRNENTPDTTQGYYTKFGKVEGVPELRYWYDRCMPAVGAREIWDRLMPSRRNATSVQGLIRAVRARAA